MKIILMTIIILIVFVFIFIQRQITGLRRLVENIVVILDELHDKGIW